MKLTKPEEIVIRIRRLGMRQSKFAEKVGIPPSTFSQMLNGHIPFPKEEKRRVNDCLIHLENLISEWK